MPVINRETTIEEFRAAVLAALDETAIDVFGITLFPLPQSPGASDCDLPNLFAAIDGHIETLAERYGFVMVDYEMESQP